MTNTSMAITEHLVQGVKGDKGQLSSNWDLEGVGGEISAAPGKR